MTGLSDALMQPGDAPAVLIEEVLMYNNCE